MRENRLLIHFSSITACNQNRVSLLWIGEDSPEDHEPVWWGWGVPCSVSRGQCRPPGSKQAGQPDETEGEEAQKD